MHVQAQLLQDGLCLQVRGLHVQAHGAHSGSSVPPAGQHAAAQTLPGLAGHLGRRARDRRHGCRQQEVADGGRARRHVVVHHHLHPRGPPLSQH